MYGKQTTDGRNKFGMSMMAAALLLGTALAAAQEADENVVHVCTRNSSNQDAPWRMDFATPCGVTMSFTRGTRYCTLDDVKTGNAEVLASCHRLRTHDIAIGPSKTKGAVERHDMVAFLVELDNGKPAMSIVVDSPARVTDNPDIVIIGGR